MPLLPLAISALLRRRQIQEEEKWKAEAKDAWTGNEWNLVFTIRYGTPINPRNLQQTFDGLLKRAELPKVRLHDLRHSVVTMLLAQGELSTSLRRSEVSRLSRCWTACQRRICACCRRLHSRRRCPDCLNCACRNRRTGLGPGEEPVILSLVFRRCRSCCGAACQAAADCQSAAGCHPAPHTPSFVTWPERERRHGSRHSRPSRPGRPD